MIRSLPPGIIGTAGHDILGEKENSAGMAGRAPEGPRFLTGSYIEEFGIVLQVSLSTLPLYIH